MPALGTHPTAGGVLFALQGKDGTIPTAAPLRRDDTNTYDVLSVGGAAIDSGSILFAHNSAVRIAANPVAAQYPRTIAGVFNVSAIGGSLMSLSWDDNSYVEIQSNSGQVRAFIRENSDSVATDHPAQMTIGSWVAVAFTELSATSRTLRVGAAKIVGPTTSITTTGSSALWLTAGGLTRDAGALNAPLPAGSRATNISLWGAGHPNASMDDETWAAILANPDIIYTSAGPVITGPTGAAGAASITTSSPENQNILGVWTATGTGTWSLSGPDAADLTISGGTVTRTAGNLDRETKPTWNFTVNFGTAAQAVVHTVTDINEPPAFIGPALGALVFTQGVPITPVPLATRFVDPEGLAITATIVGALPAGLSVVSGQLQGTPTATQAATSYTPRGADPAGNATNGTPFTIAIGATPPPPPPPPPPPAAFTALTDVMAESGINLAPGSTAFWSWFPNGRPGAMGTGIEGSSLVNAQGRALISHSVAGAGMVVVGTRPGPAVSDDRVFIDFLVLA